MRLAGKTLAAETGPSDAEAILQVLAGRRDPFRHIVRRYHRRLYYYAARKMTDDAEAEDLVQKTFVTAFHRLRDFDVRQPLLPWLRGILLNHCRHVWREREREARLRGELLEARRAELELAVPAESGDDRREDALRGCMEGLSPDEREAIRLRFVEELPLEPIGERLGRSGEGVRQFLFRLRVRLNDCVKKKLAVQEGSP